MNHKNRLLNAEYAAMHGCYWMIYCVALSFAAVFLHARGYSNAELGAVIAAGNVLALLAQPLVADLADRSKKITLIGILRAMVLVIAACLVFLLLVAARSIWLTAVYALFLACVFAIQPFANSFCGFMDSWGATINFGVARGLGSLAYAVLAVVLGVLTDRLGAGTLPAAGLLIAVLFLLLLSVLSRQYRGAQPPSPPGAAPAAEKTGIAAFFRRNPRFALFLLGTALIYFPHSLLNNFLIIVVGNVGGGSADMGTLSSATALLELPAMVLFSRLLRRFRCSTLLKFSAVMFTVKEILVCLASSMAGLYAACFFQCVSFAVFIPASVDYAQEVSDPADAVKAQAFVTSMITLGSIFSSLIGGFLYDGIGTAATLVVGACVSVAGTLVLLPAVQKTPALRR